MKKIHITEKQLNALKKQLTEQDSYTIDLTKDIEQAGGNIKNAITQLSSTNPQQGSDLKNGKATATFNTDAVVAEDCNSINNNITRVVTKKELKKKRLK